jgi:CheY-like chemotaxis protein
MLDVGRLARSGQNMEQLAPSMVMREIPNVAPTTILVVDDSAASRKLVRSALAGEGWSVVEAPDGWSAVDVVSRQPLDLILQDLFLPDFDGLDLLRYLRSLPGGASLPIVAFTGWLSKIEQARREGSAFTDYLTKPVDVARLRGTVRLYVDRDANRIA